MDACTVLYLNCSFNGRFQPKVLLIGLGDLNYSNVSMLPLLCGLGGDLMKAVECPMYTNFGFR